MNSVTGTTRPGWCLAAALASYAAMSFVAGCAAPAVDSTSGPVAASAESLTATASAGPRSTPVRYADGDALAALAESIAARLDLMRDVAAAKFLSGEPVQDRTRETAVLQHVALRAQTVGLDPQTTETLFAEQIRLARRVQERWLAQWRASGRCDPCTTPLPLPAMRERIDVANEAQLAALHLLVPLRSEEAAALVDDLHVRLASLGVTVAEVRGLAALTLGLGRTGPTGTLERVRTAGRLRIATTGDYAPFSLEHDGSLTGADIELGRELAAHLGVQPVFVRTSWAQLRDDLRSGRFDVAISGIGFTADRAALGAFSSAYQAGGKTLLARCDERGRFDTPAELDQPGVRVIVNPGGTNERYVREHVQRAQILVFPDNRGVFAEIAADRADVMVTDDVEAELQALRWPGQLCRTYPGTLTQGDKRILMARDAPLQAAVEAWLQAKIAAGEPARLLAQAMRDYASAPPAQ